MNNDLISRKYIQEQIPELDSYDNGCYVWLKREDVDNLINNAPTALFPLPVIANDKVTDDVVENLKQLMKAYKPQVLNLEIERPQGDFVKILNERISESVCKYCQMNKHCELCEISRVFSIITLTAEEQKGGED